MDDNKDDKAKADGLRRIAKKWIKLAIRLLDQANKTLKYANEIDPR